MGSRPRSRLRRWLPRVALFFVILGGGLFAALWMTSAHLAAFGGDPSPETRARMIASERYKDGHFSNVEPRPKRDFPTASILWEFMFSKEMRAPICPLPMATGTDKILQQAPASGLRITWLGHSTTLIELDGVRVLTDPIWSERASPSTLAGPRRFHPPPLALEALPPLDAVVVSHDHFDHLDMATVKRLAARGAVLHVPLGIGAHLARWGVPAAQISEHDWWQDAALPSGVRIVSTPGRHFSGRSLRDRDRTLWTSWTIVGPHHRVFFSGDTGPTEIYKTIADRFGPFDVSLLEIGQFHESWGDIHLGPIGALDAHARLRAKKLFPIHWSTFVLGLHVWSEPAERLRNEAEHRGVSVVTPRLGQPIEPTTDAPTEAWWRKLPPHVASCP